MKEIASLLVSTAVKAAILLIVITLIVRVDLREENIDSSLTNLLTVSSIVTGIVFAYLITKLFHIKAERENRKELIGQLSAKLTEFRRLCNDILHVYDFWVDTRDLQKFEQLYPLYTFTDIHHLHSDDPKVSDFWLKDQGFSTTRADLYLAFSQIYDTHDNEDWVFDRVTTFEYTIDNLRDYYLPANQIWYYLDYKWARVSEGEFDDSILERNYRSSRMIEMINKISVDYKGKRLDRKLIAQIASDFHGKYLVELSALIEKNQMDLPKSVKTMLVTQVFILIFGVLCPLIFSTIEMEVEYRMMGLKVFMTVVTGGLLFYLMQIVDFAREEIKT